jgi:hypothetical protein
MPAATATRGSTPIPCRYQTAPNKKKRPATIFNAILIIPARAPKPIHIRLLQATQIGNKSSCFRSVQID